MLQNKCKIFSLVYNKISKPYENSKKKLLETTHNFLNEKMYFLIFAKTKAFFMTTEDPKNRNRKLPAQK